MSQQNKQVPAVAALRAEWESLRGLDARTAFVERLLAALEDLQPVNEDDALDRAWILILPLLFPDVDKATWNTVHSTRLSISPQAFGGVVRSMIRDTA